LRRARKPKYAAAAVSLLALAIAGCGGAGHPGGGGQTATTSNAAPREATQSSRQQEKTFQARRRRLRARLPVCPDSGLLVWNGPGRSGVGLGHVYKQLTIANLSGHACKVSGVPEVVAVDLKGRQIGPPARVQPSLNPAAKKNSPAIVTLTRTGSARFELSWLSAYDYSPSACHIQMATGFRVKLPGAPNSQRVPYPFAACSQEVPGLSVGRIE
jgi:hypothetical protein